MMNPPPMFSPYASDHGVRPFDPDLAARRVRTVARGAFELQKTIQGRYYALITLETGIGHLSAAIHIERAVGQALADTVASSGASIPALEPLEQLADDVDTAIARLRAAAEERGTHPGILRAAVLVTRAHVGDDRARELLRRLRDAARAGDEGAKRRIRWLRVGRDFAREVLGAPTATGANFFQKLGNGIGHAVRDVSRAVKHATHDVMAFERKLEHVLGPVLAIIKQWGPMILSDIQGLVSLIPGIGTGISAALATAEAILSGALNHPLEFAIHIAYGAIPIPPGVRPITDIVLDTALEFIRNPHHIIDALIAAARDRIPKGLPQEVFDTLVRVIVKKQPILHVAADLAGHYVSQYTKGIGAALHLSIPKLPDVMQLHLGKLPDMKIAFQSIHQIAPHFTVDPKHLPEIISHASTMSGHVLDAAAHSEVLTLCTHSALAHAQISAALRVAQHAHEAPRVMGAAPGASLAIELSADGAQQRMVASASLAHLMPSHP